MVGVQGLGGVGSLGRAWGHYNHHASPPNEKRGGAAGTKNPNNEGGVP